MIQIDWFICNCRLFNVAKLLLLPKTEQVNSTLYVCAPTINNRTHAKVILSCATIHSELVKIFIPFYVHSVFHALAMSCITVPCRFRPQRHPSAAQPLKIMRNAEFFSLRNFVTKQLKIGFQFICPALQTTQKFILYENTSVVL